MFGVFMNDAGQQPALRVAVDQAAAQSPLARTLAAFDGFEVVPMTASQTENAFDRGELALVLASRGGQLEARINKSYQSVVETALKAAQAPASSEGTIPATVIEPKTSFVRYAMPGLFAMALLQLCIYATAVPLLDERAKGVWRLFGTLPISKSNIFLGETAARLVVAALQLCVLIILFETVLDFEVSVGWLKVLPIFLLATIMCVALGFALGGALPDERWGIHVLTFLNLYMLFFGNIFSPSSLDENTRWLALVNPLTYVSDAIREAITGIPGTFPMAWSIAAIAAWTVIAVIAARFLFKFETATTV